MGNNMIAKPGREERYTIDGTQVSKSCFNLQWCGELGVNPQIVFDIGSCDGGDAIRFFKEFGCKVYAFEADPKRYEITKNNCIGYEGIEVTFGAVCDFEGETQFFQSTNTKTKDIDAQGSLYRHGTEYKYNHIKQHQKSINVPALTLEGFCKDNEIAEIDVLHVDVEGAELLVIKGMGDLRPKLLYVETLNVNEKWVDAPSVSELHQYILDLGYKLILDLGTDRLYLHEDLSTG